VRGAGAPARATSKRLDELKDYPVIPLTDKRIVLSTAGSEEEAGNIARHLVENRLAACVNVVPRIESVYRWQGKVESATEWLLVIKTSAEKFHAVRDAVGRLHSYELPECILLAIEDGSDAYLTWLTESLR
jgi:periplasmic divalent cation tolerance protein